MKALHLEGTNEGTAANEGTNEGTNEGNAANEGTNEACMPNGYINFFYQFQKN